MNNSCWGCKFLYSAGDGYSNYTWLETFVNCANDRNPNLPSEQPFDWEKDLIADNWPKTNNGRCELFAYGPFVELDVDGDELPEDYTRDVEAIRAIDKHCGRPHDYEREQRAKKALASMQRGRT